MRTPRPGAAQEAAPREAPVPSSNRRRPRRQGRHGKAHGEAMQRPSSGKNIAGRPSAKPARGPTARQPTAAEVQHREPGQLGEDPTVARTPESGAAHGAAVGGPRRRAAPNTRRRQPGSTHMVRVGSVTEAAHSVLQDECSNGICDQPARHDADQRLAGTPEHRNTHLARPCQKRKVSAQTSGEALEHNRGDPASKTVWPLRFFDPTLGH